MMSVNKQKIVDLLSVTENNEILKVLSLDKHLDLSDLKLSDEQVLTLAYALKENNNIERINFSNTYLSKEGLCYLANTLRKNKIVIEINFSTDTEQTLSKSKLIHISKRNFENKTNAAKKIQHAWARYKVKKRTPISSEVKNNSWFYGWRCSIL